MPSTSIADLDVLLVEPSRTQTRIILDHLETLGVGRSRSASTGTVGCELALAEPPDLVVSAMYLEDMTAAGLIDALRAQPRTSDVGFLLASSETGFARLEPVRRAGASGLLPKPFTAQQLSRAFYSCLGVLEPERLDLGDFHPEELDVLVVDDSRLARKAIVRTLERIGIEKTTQAADGAEANPLIERIVSDL